MYLTAFNRLSEESGYSLIEVIASIIIMGIAILPMIAMFDTGLHTATTGSNYDKARMLADTNLEKVRSIPYSDARIDYKPVNATPTPGAPVPCDESMLSAAEQITFDCEVETTYVDSDLEPDSSSITKMMMVVTVESGVSGTNYTTTGLITR
jgi:prepilin-type N-terminal cleavage/methylation domain-containing protein